MRKKLNQLLAIWPPGHVATSSWLASKGISRGLARKYLASGWLVSLGYGAYARAGDTPQWASALAGLQAQKKRLWVGGPYALSLHGLVHYLPLGQESVTLYGAPGTQLPKWFRDHDWKVRLLWQTTQLLPTPESLDSNPGLVEKPVRDCVLRVSSPEQAVLEMLQGVPEKWSFDFAAEVLQGATSLSPRTLQTLLELCRNIRVKRLFLFFAQYHRHQWLDRLDVTQIELGCGKRQVVAGGCLDKTWHITVPSHYRQNQEPPS